MFALNSLVKFFEVRVLNGRKVEVLGLVGGRVDVRLGKKLMSVPNYFASPIDKTATQAVLVNVRGNLVATMAFSC
jgi:hypothetical protein